MKIFITAYAALHIAAMTTFMLAGRYGSEDSNRCKIFGEGLLYGMIPLISALAYAWGWIKP